jgi:phosphoenolpyruvate carboxykinase (ATP)
MFREDITTDGIYPDFTVIHLPYNKVDQKTYNTRTGTCMAIDFDTKTVLVIGSQYAGEIKKINFLHHEYITS